MSQPTFEEAVAAMEAGGAVVMTRKCPACDKLVQVTLTKIDHGTNAMISHEIPTCEWSEEYDSGAISEWVRSALTQSPS